MNGLELNKIAGAILLAGVVAMTSAIVAEGLYHGSSHAEEIKRGYEIEVASASTASTGSKKAKGPEPIADLLASADAGKGKALTKKCTACHSFDKGGKNKVGPNMWGVYGSKIGSHVPGFAYSDALKKHGGTWTVEELNGFLWKPKKWVKGTKMGFAGLKKPKDRANMVKYLQTLK